MLKTWPTFGCTETMALSLSISFRCLFIITDSSRIYFTIETDLIVISNSFKISENSRYLVSAANVSAKGFKNPTSIALGMTTLENIFFTSR